MERTRLPELDILRSMAFLGVVAQHVLGAWAGRTQGIFGRQVLLMVCFELVRFAVPMFVFLFAMMLAGYTDREFAYGSYLGKRVRQILCPYAVWTAIFLQYFGRFSFPKEYLRSLVLGDSMYHMWYVPMIFQFVILAPLFIWLFRRFQKRQSPRISWLCLLLLSLAWLALVSFCSGRSGAAASLISRYPNKCFAGWMVYFCAGAFCGCNYDQFRSFVRKHWKLPAALGFLGLVYIIHLDIGAIRSLGNVKLTVVGLQNMFYALYLLPVFCCLFLLADKLSSFRLPVRFCSFCAANSYRAYLLHAWFVNWINLQFMNRFELNFSPKYYLVLFLLVCFVSLSLAALINKVYSTK